MQYTSQQNQEKKLSSNTRRRIHGFWTEDSLYGRRYIIKGLRKIKIKESTHGVDFLIMKHEIKLRRG
jgi:hypothetical protein